jgi:flagellar M-ring protein FliF
VARVENMLAPLLGADGFRADVALNMIFRQTEIAQEQYTNPDMENGGVRSERWQRKLRPEGAGGVPGALTNAPPEAGLLAEEAAEGTAVQNRASEVQAEVFRNYELNKTIRYERPSPWEIQSLSVAVVIKQQPPSAEGQAQRRTAAQLQALEAIIRDAVGLNANRGDTVTVAEAPFVLPEPVEAPAPEGEPFISAQSVEGVLRQGLPGIALLALVLFVLRPFMKSVMTLPPPPKPPKDDPYMQLAAPPGMPALPPPATAEARARAISAQEMAKMNEWLDEARTMAQDDPRRIAQLTRQWMNSDG